MQDIFIDESGYTGPNLLDSAQPILAMASLSCEEIKCAEFKKRFFTGLNASELKYGALSKYPRGRTMIIDFLRALAAEPQLVKVALAHKKYALVGKMVDLVVEPAMRQNGVDLYDQGANIALTNVMFAFLGGGSHDKLLNLFQTMMRTLNPADFDRFVEELFERHSDDDEVEQILDFLRVGCSTLGHAILIDPSRTLDLAFTLTFTLVSLWSKDIPAGEGIRLIHDASSIMARNKAIWDAVVDRSVPIQEIGYDIRTHLFPIAVTDTVAEDSANSVGVQLADVVAGATASMGRALTEADHSASEYEAELIDIINSASIYKYSVWPSNKVTPEALGTIGPNAAPLDNFDAILRRAEK